MGGKKRLKYKYRYETQENYLSPKQNQILFEKTCMYINETDT